MRERDEAPEPERDAAGVDLTLIDWFLDLSPEERLACNRGWIELALSAADRASPP